MVQLVLPLTGLNNSIYCFDRIAQIIYVKLYTTFETKSC